MNKIIAFILISLNIAIAKQNFEKIEIVLDKKVTIKPSIIEERLAKFFMKERDILPQKFFISKYETTIKQYQTYLRQIQDTKNLASYGLSYEDDPLTQISFNEAQDFCRYYGGDLPTQEQWTVAASIKLAPSLCYEDLEKYSVYEYGTAIFPIKSESSLHKCLQEQDDEFVFKEAIKQLSSSQYTIENINGTFGMTGNVLEWTKDDYENYKVVKGGSFVNYAKPIFYSNFITDFLKPNTTRPNVGFRCVWSEK